MFYPEKMCRATVAAPKKHMHEIINTLYELKALHIDSYVPGELPIGSPMKDAEKISELLLDIEFIKGNLGSNATPQKTKLDIHSLKKAEKFVKKLRADVTEIASRIKAVDEKINLAEKAESDMAFLRDCGIKNLGILKEYEKLDIAFGYLPKRIEIADAVVFSKKSDKACPAAIFFRKGSGVREVLSKMKFSEIKINTEALGSKYNLESLGNERSGLQKNLGEFSKNIPVLSYVQERLLSSIAKSEAPLMFACSEYAFIVQGWVPEKNKDLLIKRLHEISSGMFIKIEPAEKGPTQVSNPAPVRPFEFFLRLYSLPSYKEIDPSFLMFITFPLFYGIMLGDIGYGLVLFAAGLLLRLKMKSFPRALADVTILSSVFTVAFGFLFGEFFGAEELFGIQLLPYIHRLTQVSEMIAYSIVLGLIHLNIGFMLGFVNEMKHGIWKAAGKLGWIGLEIGGITLLLNSVHLMQFSSSISIAIMVASFAAILKGEGLVGAIEIPSFIGNILSYARLAAIGLASASLAIVINKSAGGLFHAGGLFIALGILILLLGHMVNLALGIMDSFLQSLRLHYVEMFTKFYKGSGKPYKPFGS